MKEYKSTLYSVLISLIIFSFLTSGCSTIQFGGNDAYGGGPIEEEICSQAVNFEGDPPYDAPWAVDRACHRFSEEFDIPVPVLASVLQSLEINMVRFGQFEQCEERGRSCTF